MYTKGFSEAMDDMGFIRLGRLYAGKSKYFGRILPGIFMLLSLVATCLILSSCGGTVRTRETNNASLYHANAQRTGVFDTQGVRELQGVKWKTMVEDDGKAIYSSPCFSEDMVFIYGPYENGPYLHAFDAEKGQELWKEKAPLSTGSDACVADGIAYIPNDVSITAVSTDQGQELWEFRAKRGEFWFCTPCIEGGTAFFASVNVFYAIDARSGEKIWEHEIGERVGKSTLTCYGAGMVYFGNEDGFLYALDAETGIEIWKFDTGASVDAPPCYSNGRLYFGNTNGTLISLDVISGEEIWKFETGSPIVTTATIKDEFLYLASTDGLLYSLDATMGKELWRFETEGGTCQQLRDTYRHDSG